MVLGWKGPPPGVFKINVDGATSADGRLSSIGVVIRDRKGNTIAAMCKTLPSQHSSEGTEILAVENGVLLAKELELSQIYIELDALMVVQDIQAGNTNGSLGHLHQGINCILETFNCWKIQQLRREYHCY